VVFFAGQLGACLTEVCPDYDSLNERVIPAVRNAAPVAIVLRLLPAWCDFAAQEALADAPVRRDHEGEMTKEAPHGNRRNRSQHVARG
jgi:hypothetical protein